MSSLLARDEESRKEIVQTTATSTPGRYTYLSKHVWAKRTRKRFESRSAWEFKEGLLNSVTTVVLDSLTCCSHIINISQRIQVIAGQPLAHEDSQKVFPSFVWLLRDVLLSLPKGVENLREYFLETVISACKKS